MNSLELANRLNGREYRQEMSRDEEREARENGLVVVYGASDDLMEFSGAINDEVGVWGGGIAYLTNAGLLVNDCDNRDCPHFTKMKRRAAAIEALWDKGEYSWSYKTTIPHVSFEVMEDGEKYCKGIVFALDDVNAN